MGNFFFGYWYIFYVAFLHWILVSNDWSLMCHYVLLGVMLLKFHWNFNELFNLVLLEEMINTFLVENCCGNHFLLETCYEYAFIILKIVQLFSGLFCCGTIFPPCFSLSSFELYYFASIFFCWFGNINLICINSLTTMKINDWLWVWDKGHLSLNTLLIGRWMDRQMQTILFEWGGCYWSLIWSLFVLIDSTVLVSVLWESQPLLLLCHHKHPSVL